MSNKYIKYKTKYLNLKKQFGGEEVSGKMTIPDNGTNDYTWSTGDNEPIEYKYIKNNKNKILVVIDNDKLNDYKNDKISIIRKMPDDNSQVLKNIILIPTNIYEDENFNNKILTYTSFPTPIKIEQLADIQSIINFYNYINLLNCDVDSLEDVNDICEVLEGVYIYSDKTTEPDK